MKKIIAVLAFMVLLTNIGKVIADKPLAKTYIINDCVVVKTLPEGCQFKDANGNKWVKMYNKSDEHYRIGDVVTLTVYDKGTEFPKDDSVVRVERVG